LDDSPLTSPSSLSFPSLLRSLSTLLSVFSPPLQLVSSLHFFVCSFMTFLIGSKISFFCDRIGVHLRATDRSSELKEYFGSIMDSAKTIFQKARDKGAKRIVFFLSSDSWPAIRMGRDELTKLIDKERDTLDENDQISVKFDIVYFPNISRSPSDLAVHLRHENIEILHPFFHPIDEIQADFYRKCIDTRTEDWGATFNGESGESCLDVHGRHEIRPTYVIAADSVLEALLLAHSHFYISMAGAHFSHSFFSFSC